MVVVVVVVRRSSMGINIRGRHTMTQAGRGCACGYYRAWRKGVGPEHVSSSSGSSIVVVVVVVVVVVLVVCWW